MTDSKEWVTVKVPKAVRDTAQDADPTYGELLSFGVEAYKAGVVGANQDGDIWVNEPDGGEPCPPAVFQLDDDEAVDELNLDMLPAMKGDIDADAIAREVAEELAGRLDDLETNIERKIELEVRG